MDESECVGSSQSTSLTGTIPDGISRFGNFSFDVLVTVLVADTW